MATRETLAKDRQHQDATTEAECHAMRLLSGGGWGHRTLAMAFEVDKSNVSDHVSGDCAHSPFPIPPKGGDDG